MISQDAFTYATSEAKKLAEHFWNHLESDQVKLLAALGEEGKTSAILTELSKYVEAYLGSQVQYVRRLPPGYASWLWVINSNFVIVVDVQQLDVWAKRDASPPVAVQKIRSIVHELGHILLHGTQLKPQNAPGPVASVDATQEAAAWVFAMTFVGVLFGCYSERSRNCHPSCDDAPRLYL